MNWSRSLPGSTSLSTSRSKASVPTRSSASSKVSPRTGFAGLNRFFRGLESRTHRLQNRLFVSRFRRLEDCPTCHGSRLRPEALAVKIEGHNIASLSAMTIGDLRALIRRAEWLHYGPASGGVLAQIEHRLGYLADIGLDYLTLDRPAANLAAGERNRVSF